MSDEPPRKTETLQVRCTEDVLIGLDELRREHLLIPSRAGMARIIIEEAIAEHRAAEMAKLSAADRKLIEDLHRATQKTIRALGPDRPYGDATQQIIDESARLRNEYYRRRAELPVADRAVLVRRYHSLELRSGE